MTEQELNGGTQPPAKNTEAAANPSEPNESDDIKFTPEQQKRLGKLLSAERDKVRDQFKDYDELKTKLREIEKSKLTESQRLQQERDDAIKEKDALSKKVEKLGAVELRTKLFADFRTKDGQGLPSHLIKYVTGKDEASITASIESIATDFGAKLGKKQSIGSPTPPGSERATGKHDFINAQILSAAGYGSR
ncbi:hypothetical protein M0R72_14945 [Candidatus Pacearchaeota archaeon]|jgi:hypothetical protein|nr:hypothetical protein [Candidatus Pacearchaeota archaeon]